MPQKSCRVVLTILFLCVATLAHAESLKDIEKRLDRIEAEQNQMKVRSEEGKGKVQTFISEKMTFGGFFETGVKGLFGPDTDTQVSADSHVLGLNITADLSERFRFVNQSLIGLTFPFVNPHNNPSHAIAGLATKREFSSVFFGALIAQGYLEYNLSDAFKIQTGLGYVPFGYAYQQREPVLFLRRSGPLMIRTGDANGLGVAYPLWSGLHILGSLALGSGHWGYDAYSFTPTTDVKTMGGGARLWWTPPGDRLTIGTSAQIGERGTDTYYALGADARLEFERFGVKAEYGRNMPQGGDPWSFYVEPYVDFFDDRLVLFAMADYIDNTVGVTARGATSVADPFKKWEYGGGLNWLPIPAVRLRFTFTSHDYVGATAVIAGQDRDYYQGDFSTGIAF